MRSATGSLLLLALAAACAACGDVTSPGGGGGSDGGPDGGGPSDAAVPGTVTVTVLDYDGTREPVEDVDVLFVEPDGSVAATEQTGADGQASAELLPGGAVIAFTTIDAPLGVFQPQIWAVVGVKPGDDIVLGGRLDQGMQTDDMTYNLPLPPFKSADFLVYTPCGPNGSASTAVGILFYESCDQSPTAGVAYTFSGEDRWAVTDDDIEIDDGSAVPFGGEWEQVPSPDVTLENLHDVRELQLEWTRALLGGVNVPLALAQAGGNVDGNQLTLSPEKVVQPDHVNLTVTLAAEQYAALGTQIWHLWQEGGGNDDDVVIDADDHRLPWVGRPVFDSATRVFGWPQVGEGEWDATYLDFTWVKSEGKASTTIGRVRVVAPPGRSQFVLPPVPEDFEMWLPPELDEIEANVLLFDSDALDWDKARQLGIDPSNAEDHAGQISEPAIIRYSSSIPADS